MMHGQKNIKFILMSIARYHAWLETSRKYQMCNS